MSAPQFPADYKRAYSFDEVWDAFLAEEKAFYSTVSSNGWAFKYHDTVVCVRVNGRFFVTLSGMNTRNTREKFNFALKKLGIEGKAFPVLPGKIAGGPLELEGVPVSASEIFCILPETKTVREMLFKTLEMKAKKGEGEWYEQ